MSVPEFFETAETLFVIGNDHSAEDGINDFADVKPKNGGIARRGDQFIFPSGAKRVRRILDNVDFAAEFSLGIFRDCLYCIDIHRIAEKVSCYNGARVCSNGAADAVQIHIKAALFAVNKNRFVTRKNNGMRDDYAGKSGTNHLCSVQPPGFKKGIKSAAPVGKHDTVFAAEFFGKSRFK